MKRSDMLRKVASIVDMAAQASRHPLRVAIDGPDAAGKTTLANQLAYKLERTLPNSILPAGPGERKPRTIRISADDYPNPPRTRYRKGRLSAAAYVYHSINYKALLADVMELEARQAGRDTLLLIDGVFLQTPWVRCDWDFVIYLTVDPDVSLHRGLEREKKLRVGQSTWIEEYEREKAFRVRYLPGQKIYRRDCHPERRANLVIDNNDPDYPIVSWGEGTANRRPYG